MSERIDNQGANTPKKSPKAADNNRHASGLTRRQVLRGAARGAIGLGLAGAVTALARNSSAQDMVWQIDPNKCVQCGNCRVNCVLEPTAVKCVHAFALCGFCNLCTGYYPPDPLAKDTAAENQLCPTGAIVRRFVEDPHYEYTIDESLCVGCGKCVKGCTSFGNGSLLLQIRHDRCVNCNQCSIAAACPSQAISRVPASQPYLLKGLEKKP